MFDVQSLFAWCCWVHTQRQQYCCHVDSSFMAFGLLTLPASTVLICRVYLIGGAEATGKANDTAPVYTPAFHHYTEEGKRRVYVWNMTLPEGFFSRSPMTHDAGMLKAPP